MCANVIIASEAATGKTGIVAKKLSFFCESRFLKGTVELSELTWLFSNSTKNNLVFHSINFYFDCNA